MQWTSSVSSRSASVRLRAVRTRTRPPEASSISGIAREPAGSSSMTSRVRSPPGTVSDSADRRGAGAVPSSLPIDTGMAEVLFPPPEGTQASG